MGSITRSFANNILAAGKFDGTKLTGDIPEANLSANAPAFDDNKIVNDLSTLGLRVHTQENLSASNTNSQYVDVFQDSTGIDTQTNTGRNASEYVSAESEALSTISINDTNYDTYFGTQAQSSTSQGYMLQEHSVSGNSGRLSTISDFNPANTYNLMGAGAYTDVMAEHFKTGSKFSVNQNYVLYHQFQSGKRYYSLYKFKDGNTFKPTSSYFIWRNGSSYNSDFNWVGVDSSNNVTILDDITPATSNTNGSITNNQGYTSSSSTSTYFPILGYSFTYTGNNGGGYDDVAFGGELKSTAFNATGNFTSNAISTADSSTINKAGAVITYQDNAGTNALNTDIVLQISADNGSNYTTATLTALPDFSSGIKCAKVNDLSIGTPGSQLKYKILFANQSSGVKEARIRGVSLNY